MCIDFAKSISGKKISNFKTFGTFSSTRIFRKKIGHTDQNLHYLIIPKNLKILVCRYRKVKYLVLSFIHICVFLHEQLLSGAHANKRRRESQKHLST